MVCSSAACRAPRWLTNFGIWLLRLKGARCTFIGGEEISGAATNQHQINEGSFLVLQDSSARRTHRERDHAASLRYKFDGAGIFEDNVSLHEAFLRC